MDASPGTEELRDSQGYVESDNSDFQAPIPMPDDASNKRRMEDSDSQEDEEDVTVCAICQKEWVNNGLHSIAQMKCGHCFGRSCISQYKRDSSKFNCPLCGQLTSKRELRKIWPAKLFPEKKAYIDELTLELKELDVRLEQLAIKNADVQREMSEKKAILDSFDLQPIVLSSQPTQEIEDSQAERGFTFHSRVSMEGEVYYVLDLNPLEDMAVVSTHQQVTRRYGFRKINMYDPSVTEFIPTNHQNTIRDIKHSPNGMLLSTGDDKTLKLTSISKNLVVQSYTLEAPSRACAFDNKNANLLYCGLTTGTLMVYDVRNTRGYLSKLVDAERNSPIISVISAENSIICTDQYASYTWDLREAQQYIAQPLYIPDRLQNKDTENSIYSVSMTEKVLITSTTDGSMMKHHVNKITNENGQKACTEDWSCSIFQNAPSICRNTHFIRDGNVFLCYAEKDQVAIQAKDGQDQALASSSPVLAIQHTNNGINEFLATLSNDALCIYKFNVENTQ